MKLLLFITLAFSCPSFGSVIISAENDWAPWSSENAQGEAVGRTVEYTRKIFRSFNVTAKFRAVPFSRCLIEAQEGKTLGCFHTAKTPEHLQNFDFPDVPLVEDEVSIYTLTKPTEGANSLQDLKGEKVGVTLGYAYSPEFDADQKLFREESKGDLHLFKKLVGGRLPYIAVFKGAAESILISNPEFNVKGLRSFSVGKAQFYLAFSRNYPNSKRFLKRYNQATKNFPTLHMHPLNVKIYGDRSYPPYSYADAAGTPLGIYVELLDRVFAEMKDDFNVTIEMVPWSRGLHLLRSGQGFALFPPYKIASRTYIDTYSEPLNTERVVFYCNDPSLSVNKTEFPRSFKGLRIGVTQDFILDRRLSQQFNEGHMIRVDVMDNISGLVQLANKNIDCYVNDSLSVEWAYSQIKKNNHPILQKFPSFTLNESYTLSSQQAYLAFPAVDNNFPHKSHFIKKFNVALKKVLADGTLNAIRLKYLPH